MSRTRGSTFIGLLVASLWLAGCADPCTDDGLAWKQKESCAQGSASATEGSTTSASATASASATTSASASASATDSATGSGSASATGTGTDTDPASASATMTATGGDGCSDGVQNGDETDVDCGGACGPTCEVGEGCMGGGDCISMMCDGSVCIPDPGCSDGVVGPGETDVDCGGVCGPTCANDFVCVDDGDCLSGYCDGATDTCQDPTCADGVQNGDETDVDCGGACGPTCGTDQMCVVDDDCVSLICDGGLCQADSGCTNGMLDMGETDVDCGGVCGPTCEIDETCEVDSDCVSMYCRGKDNVCAEPACDDGVQNGDETDVDCGGSCGATCESGEMCVVDGDCVSMACGGGVCVDAMCAVTMDDNGCQACIKTNCCDGVIDCLADPKCTCWLDCIQHNNDFMPCVQTCMLNAKPGAITSCANSKCNTINACAKP